MTLHNIFKTLISLLTLIPGALALIAFSRLGDGSPEMDVFWYKLILAASSGLLGSAFLALFYGLYLFGEWLAKSENKINWKSLNPYIHPNVLLKHMAIFMIIGIVYNTSSQILETWNEADLKLAMIHKTKLQQLNN